MKRIKCITSVPSEIIISMPNWMYWFFKRYGDLVTNRLGNNFNGKNLEYVVCDESGNIEFRQIF